MKTTTVRLPEELLAQIKKAAHREETSQSHYIQSALEAAVKKTLKKSS
jgi:Arc/MetJ-type ribon-helix-helix transcriptional regulator